MPMVPELLLHKLWPHLQRFYPNLTTTDGRPIEIINPGIHNQDAGPDFLNASIRIGGIIWNGDVEIHIRASDWVRHHHQTDPAYNTVILHAVAIDDAQVHTTKGDTLITLQFPDVEQLTSRYSALSESPGIPRCGKAIGALEPVTLTAWLSRLLFERLNEKNSAIFADVAQCELSWEESFYRAVARALGLKVNALPMQTLAESVPLKVLYKSRSSLTTLEAILLGQSGLLADSTASDPYIDALRLEHGYQAKKNQLTPMNPELWRFMRIRPSAFPTIRISQLAGLLYSTQHLFSKVLAATSYHALQQLFVAQASPYWETHHRPAVLTKSSATKMLGSTTIRAIILNAALPYRFAYATQRADQALLESTMALLEETPPEDNTIVRAFANAGIQPKSALETQAVIQLRKKYCQPRLCYACPVCFHALAPQIDSPE